jgi:hypothetical protein
LPGRRSPKAAATGTIGFGRTRGSATIEKPHRRARTQKDAAAVRYSGARLIRSWG